MKKIVVIVILLLLLIVAGVGFLKQEEIKGKAKIWRAGSHLKKAQAAQAEGNEAEARRFAISSYYMNPQLEPLKILFASEDPTDKSQTQRVANAIFFHPDATAEDRAKCLDLFLPSRNQRLLRQLFQSIPQEDRKNAEIKYRQARYFATFGNPGLALKILEDGPKDDFRFDFFKTAIRSLANDGEMRKQGQQQLAELIAGSDEAKSNQAFNYLRSLPFAVRESKILRPAAEQWIAKQPEKRAADQLVLETFDWIEAGGLEQKPASDKIARNTAKKLGAENPVLIGNWLIKIGQWSEAYDLTSKAYENTSDTTIQDRVKQYFLYQIQLQALEQTKRWEDMKNLLASPPKDYPNMQVATLRAVTAQRLEDKASAIKYWQEAWKHAELDSSLRNSYLDLYQSASKAGETDLAVRSMLAASKHRLGLMPSGDQLTFFMIFLSQNKKDKELVEFTNNLINRGEAFGPPVINNMIYLRELMGKPIENADKLMASYLERYPDVAGLGTTTILVLINQERYDEAYEIAKNIIEKDGELEKLQPAEYVLLAAAHKFAGKEFKAGSIENIQDKIDLTLEMEKKQFREWFKVTAKP